jgi:hypothetical protein
MRDSITGFYNRDEKCFLRGTGWMFKRNTSDGVPLSPAEPTVGSESVDVIISINFSFQSGELQPTECPFLPTLVCVLWSRDSTGMYQISFNNMLWQSERSWIPMIVIYALQWPDN